MNKVTELELQKAVHNLLSDPSAVRATSTGKRLQILSPGRLNVHAGPDFKDMAILLEGIVIVGDGEFHRFSTEWFSHKHNEDSEYNSVVLHIVLNDNNTKKMPFDTLILNKVELRPEIDKMPQANINDLHSIHDLQDYALMRLLRKTSDSKKVLEYAELNDALRTITSKFLERYFHKKRRPVYSDLQFKEIINNLGDSEVLTFLEYIKMNKPLNILELIPALLSKKISNEGINLRLEILLNCIVPLALNLAEEETRISLFLWYWSTPSLNKYGLLSRRFKNIPQDYIWQQQGMLEYIKEQGRKQNVISDVIKNYGFAEILSFYRIGRAAVD